MITVGFALINELKMLPNHGNEFFLFLYSNNKCNDNNANNNKKL